MTKYIARKPLNVMEGGKIKVIPPNQEVIGFEDWPEVPKRAHLNMGYVEKVEVASPPGTQAPAAAQVSVSSAQEAEPAKQATNKKPKKGAKSS